MSEMPRIYKRDLPRGWCLLYSASAVVLFNPATQTSWRILPWPKRLY